MSNQAYTDFIKTKLNEQAGDTEIFGGGHLFAYTNGELTFDVANAQTLQIDKKDLIPFIITSFDGERIGLETTKILQRTLPIVFSIKYSKRLAFEKIIEAFADEINGKTFTVNGVNTGFTVTIPSPLGGSVELSAEDWIQVTLTVFAYEGNVRKGNDMVYSLNGETIEPLNYVSSMQNETSYATPQSKNYGINRSNSKQHTRSFTILLLNEYADTWVKEIEGDVLNTTYAINVRYPFDTPYDANRTMMLDRGTVAATNGTAILLELVYVDA